MKSNNEIMNVVAAEELPKHNMDTRFSFRYAFMIGYRFAKQDARTALLDDSDDVCEAVMELDEEGLRQLQGE